jgi:FXSXX-COOH protein
MDDGGEDTDVGLVDLTEVTLTELRLRDDSAFAKSLRRIVRENDDPHAVMVVGFQSAV